MHGRFSPDTALRRCGSWSEALRRAGLRPSRNFGVPKETCLRDLKRVAKKLKKPSVTTEEYRKLGNFSLAPFIRHFGSWFATLDAAGLKKTRNLHLTEEDYFENLEKMWVHLGRQPHYGEVRKPFSRYSAKAYTKRFGTWRNALEAFVAFVNREPDQEGRRRPHTASVGQEEGQGLRVNPQIPSPGESRHISWRDRFLVMRRDDFKCRCCGNSPALTPGLVLHVDHVHPWSKSGSKEIDNLQTLCDRCNIGKSDLPMTEKEDSQ